MKRKHANPYLNLRSATYFGWFTALLLFAGLGLYLVTLEKEKTYIRKEISTAKREIAHLERDLRWMDASIAAGTSRLVLERRLESEESPMMTLGVREGERAFEPEEASTGGRFIVVSYRDSEGER